MNTTIRTALPGYNAEIDTNLDHFSLYADLDNVLIKRFLKGKQNVIYNSGLGYGLATIPHKLGYIPFFMVHYNLITSDNYWRIMNNQYNIFQPPAATCGCDAQNLYILNFQANAPSTYIPTDYDIFYDDMSFHGAPSITNVSPYIKVARPGKNAESTNPNDLILHSFVNNFKILKQGTIRGVAMGTFVSPTAFNHGASIQSPYKFICFMKFPDGKTALVGDAITYSYDESKWAKVFIDGAKIYTYGSGTFNVDITYIIYGSGVNGTLNDTKPYIKASVPGINAETATNPDSFNFHSNYPTLKYYQSGSDAFGSITTTTTHTVTHGLGYTPFFIGFPKDLSGIWSSIGIATDIYAIAPFYWGRSNIPNPLKDIGCFVYVDNQNLYLKTYYQTNAVGTSTSPAFYWKLFKNRLNL